MKEVLKIRNLSKKFNDDLIINSLNTTIYEGDVFGLLGHNGSGKTTTIKLILGLMKCTSGEIYINGINVVENYEKAIENIAAVMEKPKFYNNLSAYDNLKLIRNFYKQIPETKISQVLKLVNLENNMNTKVKYFSLDMRKRLGMASALIISPKIILMDEPFNGLDNQERLEIIKLIKHLSNEEKISFFISSHLSNEVELIYNRAAIISNGVIKMQGTIEDLFRNNKNVYEFIVDDKEKAKKIIESIEGTCIQDITNKGIIVELINDESWKINKQLTVSDVKVIEIHKVRHLAKNLFDQ